MGNDFRLLGQYKEVTKCHEKAVIIQKKILGEEHTDVAPSYNNLGSDFQLFGQYNETKQCHEKALIIQKKILGEEHTDVASTYNNLGNDYGCLGQYNEAKEYHEKALVIKKKIFGEKNMPKSQEAITIWEVIFSSLDSTMKQKNTTRKHWSSGK